MKTKINMMWASFTAETIWEDHDKYKEGLRELIYEDAKKLINPIDSGVAERVKSNLSEPPLDLFVKYAEDERLKPLLQFIDEKIANIYLSLCEKYASSKPFPKDFDIFFRDSWYHITKDRGYHDMHFHGNSSFCGIYYLDVGECDLVNANGVNRFLSPFVPSTDDIDQGYAWWSREFLDIEPKDGKLVIFPGYLYHNATPYQGNKDRLIFAFNSQIRNRNDGKVGQTIASLFRHLPISLEENSNTSI